jgi:hypothetical protein
MRPDPYCESAPENQPTEGTECLKSSSWPPSSTRPINWPRSSPLVCHRTIALAATPNNSDTLDMLSGTAIALALAFWAPVNGGQQIPCSAADIHRYGNVPTEVANAGLPTNADGYAFTQDADGNLLAPHCDIYIADAVDAFGIGQQCAILAHEWGHAWMQFGHSPDPTNVMYETAAVTARCQPPKIRSSHYRWRAGPWLHSRSRPHADNAR